MLLYACTLNGAKKRISKWKKGALFGTLKVTLSKYQIPGSRGTGKVVIELRGALEYILAQSGPVSTVLRRALIEIALRAAAGDADLFTQVSEWKKTMDPSVRSMLMSGYVRSAEAEEKDALAPPEEVALPLPEDSVDAGQFLCYRNSDQDMSTWLQRSCGLTASHANHEIFDPLRQAAVLGMSRETFDKLMTEAFAEWRKHYRAVQLAAQKQEE